MDWNRIEAALISILRAMVDYPHPLDTGTILNISHGQDLAWREDHGDVLTSFQALELVDRLGYAYKADGLNRVLTEDGRSVLRIASVGPWHIDKEDARVRLWEASEMMDSSRYEERVSNDNVFRRLKIAKWRQFEGVDISFHPRLTIITGANGAGKTTLLNVLAPHFSWSAQLVSSSSRKLGADTLQHFREVGQLVYSNGARTAVAEYLSPGVQVSSLQLPAQQTVPGIFISSHRSISTYQPLQNLPARFSTADVLLQQFAGEVQARYLGGSSQFPPLYRMKEALVAAAMYAYGNEAVVANDDARHIWEGFQRVLRKFLPRSLAFEKLQVIDGDVLIQTGPSQFPLEAVSGGLSAMLELAWQIFLRGRQSPSFTVCIDEPENHLHPELQRSLIPALLEAFPEASFIIATHSPFVVTAARDSNVYALSAGPDGAVSSRLVENLKASGTSDDTLMSVLGLDTPLPLWAEDKLSRALSEISANPSAEELRNFRNRLVEAGLQEQFPAAVKAIRESDVRD